MRVGKRPVETIKDGNDDCDRTGRNEIKKISGNGHDTLLSMGCVSTRPATSITSPRKGKALGPRVLKPLMAGASARYNIISKIYQRCPAIDIKMPCDGARSIFQCPLSEYWRCTITVSSDRGCALPQVAYSQLSARARISAVLKVKAPSRASLGPAIPPMAAIGYKCKT